MSATRLLVASHNPGKIREIAALLRDTSYDVCSLADFPHIPDIPEYGTTFDANATHKARTARKHTGLLALADDSGLEVAALGNQPGVRSARFAGADATDHDRNQRILEMLRAAGGAPRSARFCCAIAVASESETRLCFGDIRGTIAEEPRGTNGFGYDAIFIPEGYDQTFGELPPDVKNTISHRARALIQAVEYLKRVIAETEPTAGQRSRTSQD